MNPPPVQAWPGAVLIQGSALRAALNAVLIAARNRRLSGLQSSLVYEDLAAAFISASAIGQVDVPDVVVLESLPTVPIEKAAGRMNLSRRQVRRLAPQLGGRLIGGRWLLDDQAIEDHMEGRSWTEGN